MDLRLHSAEKYEIKYGSNSFFNWKIDKVNFIINILAEYDCWYEGECLSCAKHLSANKEILLANVDKIINADKTWVLQEALNDYLEELENEDNAISREYLHKHLKELIEQADSRNGNVYFAWL